MKRIVVTGASGFLGRSLMVSLRSSGMEVVGVSRRSIPGLVHVHEYLDLPEGDVLVHLAEASDRAWAQRNESWYESEAARRTENLVRKGFGRVVYASSATLYGDRASGPRSTEDAVHGTDAYSRAKIASEVTVLNAGGVIARLTNLYGPGMSERNVLSTIMSQLTLEGPVRVMDGSPVRDFLWVDDAAAALCQMALGKASGVYNVGTGTGTSIEQLARDVLRLAGQSGRPVEFGATGTESRLIVDISRTVAQYGWRPAVDLKAGIARMLGAMVVREGEW